MAFVAGLWPKGQLQEKKSAYWWFYRTPITEPATNTQNAARHKSGKLSASGAV